MSHWFYTDANFLLLYSSGLISFLCSWFWDSQIYGFSRGAGPSLRAPCFSRTGPCGSQGNGRFPGSAAPAPGSADGLRSGCRAPGPGGHGRSGGVLVEARAPQRSDTVPRQAAGPEPTTGAQGSSGKLVYLKGICMETSLWRSNPAVENMPLNFKIQSRTLGSLFNNSLQPFGKRRWVARL